MDKKIKRKYGMPDEVMLIHAQVILKQVTEEHALFLPKFPWLTGEYLNEFKNALEAADDGISDYTVTAENKVKGYKDPLMDEAKKRLRMLFTYAYAAYPDHEKKQLMFGQSQMTVARNNIDKMVTLLKYAYFNANKNPAKNDLINKGYSQEEIANLQITAQRLKLQQNEHREGQTHRPVLTAERIVRLNAAYQYIWTMSKCAQIVYQKNPAKIKQYRMYPYSR